MAYRLPEFLNDARRIARDCDCSAKCVAKVAPLMSELLSGPRDWVKPEHLKGDPTGYARNLVCAEEDGSMSLFTLVWRPGQWTPVHDHGSWGVVGVIDGILEERNHILMNHDRCVDGDIELARGGVIMLAPGTVTTFVPNPDHIHQTGVSINGRETVSLHLYGRNMNSYNVYDLKSKSRHRVDLAANVV